MEVQVGRDRVLGDRLHHDPQCKVRVQDADGLILEALDRLRRQDAASELTPDPPGNDNDEVVDR